MSARLLLCHVLCGPIAQLALSPPAVAAENLRLQEGISFYQDTDAGFPIVGDGFGDMSVAKDRPTFIFFGAAGDLNTNRQARWIVNLYQRYKSAPVKFIVIDVDKPANREAKQLIKDYYRGFIPFQMVLDKDNNKRWSQIGEVNQHQMESQIDSVLH